MNVLTLLEDLQRRDIALRVDNGRLCCSAPAGALTPALRERIAQHKQAIVEFLLRAQAIAAAPPAIVPLQPRGTRPPVFGVAGHNGDVFCYRELAHALGDEQPFFGLQPPGLDGRASPLASVDEQAAYFAAQIRAFRPGEPCIVAGYCAGGAIAFDLAHRLAAEGAGVRFVALFGSPYPLWYRPWSQLHHRLGEGAARIARHWRELYALGARQPRDLPRYVADRLRERRAALAAEEAAAANPVRVRRQGVEAATMHAVRHYTPRHFSGEVRLFLPNRRWRHAYNRRFGWPADIAATLTEVCGPDDCEGHTMLQPPYVAAFAHAFANFSTSAASL